jgi:hypothetical protein
MHLTHEHTPTRTNPGGEKRVILQWNACVVDQLTSHREAPEIYPCGCKRNGRHPIANGAQRQQTATCSAWTRPELHISVERRRSSAS